MGENNRPQDRETNVADEAILEDLEQRFRVLRYGAPAPGNNVPAVPKAVEIGKNVAGAQRKSTPVKSNSDSSAIIIAALGGSATEVSEQQPDVPIVMGDLCLFSNGEIGICYQEALGAPYAIFLMCMPQNRLEERGILLDENRPICIGHLTDGLFGVMSGSLSWDRDSLVFSLKSIEFIPYIRALDANKLFHRTPSVAEPHHTSSIVTPPMSSVPKSVPTPALAPKPVAIGPRPVVNNNGFAPPRAPKPPEPDEPMASTTSASHSDTPLCKGREISIKHSAKHTWRAVFMGEDEVGHVMAFKTMNGWELTRVNLNDYLDKIEFGPLLSSNQVAEIEDDILRNS